MEEKYFVLSEGEMPEMICFSMEDAVSKNYTYIDSFDINGYRIKSYRRVNKNIYTTSF